jgi:threonine/homoserine/homoserine lactone efflux protein
MFAEITRFASAFWVIFSFSFLIALTGAMMPGPLLTYTIIKSMKGNRRGYLMGIWIIAGHAIIEMAIIIALLLGFSFVLENTIVVRTIGILGGVILIYFGISIVRDAYRGTISNSFFHPSDVHDQGTDQYRGKALEHPVFGGILVSMSNPYWWVWWATIGFAFIIQFNISFQHWPRLVAFFLGHEAGDLLWYLLISFLAYFGLRHLNKKAYYGILVFCGIFMILFGIYLGGSPLLAGKG